MDYIDVDQFLTYYYRNPEPERAAGVLAWYVASEAVADPASSYPADYFFARLAQRHPELRVEYDRVRQAASPAGNAFVTGVLRQVATGRSGPTNALDRPITSASGSDLLWAEFVLTGSSAPITRLIGLLDRPDIVRMELQQWLDSWFGRLFGLGRRDVCARLHALAGIDCDPDRRVIETADDLDCLCMMEGVHLDPERFLVTREHLPFRLRGHDMELMGVKATAKWSLASNANRHPAVLTLCEEALVGSEGPQRAALQEIVQAAHDKRRAYEEVMVLLEHAKAGDAGAQYRMGTLYHEGEGVHRSAELAAAWYHRAARQGHAEAQYRLGACHYHGDGVPEDEAEAARWLRQAVEQGVAEAQLLVSEALPPEEALHWLKQAAGQGLAEAQYRLGGWYFEDSPGDAADANAVSWYRKAAVQGHAEAQYALGDMFANGWGVERDIEVAADWFRKAAAQGDEYAEEELIELLASGQVAPRDGVELNLVRRRSAARKPRWIS